MNLIEDFHFIVNQSCSPLSRQILCDNPATVVFRFADQFLICVIHKRSAFHAVCKHKIAYPLVEVYPSATVIRSRILLPWITHSRVNGTDLSRHASSELNVRCIVSLCRNRRFSAVHISLYRIMQLSGVKRRSAEFQQCRSCDIHASTSHFLHKAFQCRLKPILYFPYLVNGTLDRCRIQRIQRNLPNDERTHGSSPSGSSSESSGF